MPVRLGGAGAALRLGAQPVARAYLGASLVYDGSAFDPLALASLAGWYDATDAGTITETDGLVVQWDDKSPAGNHLQQTTGSAQPSLSSDGGRQTILTSQGTYFRHTFALAGSLTVFVALRMIDFANEFAAMMAINPQFQIDAGSNAGFLANLRTNGSLGAVDGLVGGTDLVGAWHVLGLRFDAARGAIDLWTDDPAAPVTTDQYNGALSGDYALAFLTNRLANRGFDGHVGEMVVCTGAASDEEVTATMGYLAGRWTT